MAPKPYHTSSGTAALGCLRTHPHMNGPFSQNPNHQLRAASTAIRLSPELMAHVDRERDLVGLSRAAFIRQLIADDMRRSARTSRRAAQP
jgi:hypothetical protein